MTGQPLLLYAMGGGLGHLQRALALGRRLRRTHAVTIVTNCPFASLAEKEQIPTIVFEGTARAPIEAGLAELFAARSGEVLVVDTFPAGPTGELSRLSALLPKRRILISRRLRGYPHKPSEWPDYGLVIACEPSAGGPPPSLTVPPLLIRLRSELLQPSTARHRLGIADDDERSLLLAFHHGYADEVEAFFRTVRTAYERMAPDDWILRLLSLRPLVDAGLAPYHQSYWPALEVLPAAAAAITAGGYHSCHEVALAGIPAVHIPMSRQYDGQAARVQATGSLTAGSAYDLERSLCALFRRVTDGKVARSQPGEGALQAAEAIEQWLATE